MKLFNVYLENSSQLTDSSGSEEDDETTEELEQELELLQEELDESLLQELELDEEPDELLSREDWIEEDLALAELDRSEFLTLLEILEICFDTLSDFLALYLLEKDFDRLNELLDSFFF